MKRSEQGLGFIKSVITTRGFRIKGLINRQGQRHTEIQRKGDTDKDRYKDKEGDTERQRQGDTER